MNPLLLSMLRCPVTQAELTLNIISTFENGDVKEGVLYSEKPWFFPVIGGVPRLLVESHIDNADFLRKHCPDYNERVQQLKEGFGDVIRFCQKKNQRTKEIFSFEWGLLDYEQEDQIWGQNREELAGQFFEETGETSESLAGKIVLDAGCGHGILSNIIAAKGADIVVGLDMSQAIDRAFKHFASKKVFFVQGDLMFPPLKRGSFDLVHSSGVIHHTYDTELSFSILHELVSPKNGKFCVWLYHPINTFVHKCFTWARPYTCRLPLRVQYWLYTFTLFPPAYIAQKLAGKKVNRRELMIDLMDGLSPEYRYEHSPTESAIWYRKRGYSDVKATAIGHFGFAMHGTVKHDF